MQKHITKVLQYCEENEIEMNFSPEGIGLWTANVVKDVAVKNTHVKTHNVVTAVNALVNLRKSVWVNS